MIKHFQFMIIFLIKKIKTKYFVLKQILIIQLNKSGINNYNKSWHKLNVNTFKDCPIFM